MGVGADSCLWTASLQVTKSQTLWYSAFTSIKPRVTFKATQHHPPGANIILHCFVAKSYVYVQLVQSLLIHICGIAESNTHHPNHYTTMPQITIKLMSVTKKILPDTEAVPKLKQQANFNLNKRGRQNKNSIKTSTKGTIGPRRRPLAYLLSCAITVSPPVQNIHHYTPPPIGCSSRPVRC